MIVFLGFKFILSFKLSFWDFFRTWDGVEKCPDRLFHLAFRVVILLRYYEPAWSSILTHETINISYRQVWPVVLLRFVKYVVIELLFSQHLLRFLCLRYHLVILHLATCLFSWRFPLFLFLLTNIIFFKQKLLLLSLLLILVVLIGKIVSINYFLLIFKIRFALQILVSLRLKVFHLLSPEIPFEIKIIAEYLFRYNVWHPFRSSCLYP
jgi:hypothetical protein